MTFYAQVSVRELMGKKKKRNPRLWSLGREKSDEKDRGTRRKG